jgi:hypothetical protein
VRLVRVVLVGGLAALVRLVLVGPVEVVSAFRPRAGGWRGASLANGRRGG